jgi:hypothetical protein
VLSVVVLSLLAGCESKQVIEPPGTMHHGQLLHVALGDPYEALQPTLAAGGSTAAPGYFAYIPAQTSGPLPVLYMLADIGQDESAFPYIVGLPVLLDRMIEDREMEPRIVIMPNGLNEMGGSFYTNSMLAGESAPLEASAFGAWSMQLLQIMEDAEQRFLIGTEGLTVEAALAGALSGANRALGGIGMGAYGAFTTALRAPVFEALLLHSGIFDLRGALLLPDPTLGESWGDLLLDESRALLGRDSLVPESASLRDNPQAPMTRLLFAMSAAFSPVLGPLDSFDMASQIDSTLVGADPDGDPLNNFQYPVRLVEEGVDAGDDLWLGVWLPVQADGGIVDAVLLRWTLFHDPVYLASAGGPEITALAASGVRLWMDVGTSDELGLTDDNSAFAASLDSIFAELQFSTFGGGHADKLTERLALSLAWLD